MIKIIIMDIHDRHGPAAAARAGWTASLKLHFQSRAFGSDDVSLTY
jgi:hypothetical protein